MEGGTGPWKEKGVIKGEARGFGQCIIPIYRGNGQVDVVAGRIWIKKWIGYQIRGKKDDEKRLGLQDHRRALKPISNSSQKEFAPPLISLQSDGDKMLFLFEVLYIQTNYNLNKEQKNFF